MHVFSQESARLKEEEDDAQGAAYLAYKVLIVDNQATRQKQFQFKAKSSSEVILRLSLKAVSVYPRTSKTVPAITEIDYRSLKAVTLKGMDERSFAMCAQNRTECAPYSIGVAFSTVRSTFSVTWHVPLEF
jgi:hypothetical protein